MASIYQFETKEFEKRYGPAIAQFLCDELENTKRIEEKQKEHALVNGYGEKTLMYKAA